MFICVCNHIRDEDPYKVINAEEMWEGVDEETEERFVALDYVCHCLLLLFSKDKKVNS